VPSPSPSSAAPTASNPPTRPIRSRSRHRPGAQQRRRHQSRRLQGLRAPALEEGHTLFFQSRLDIRAAPIDHPRIVLAPGWVEGMQVNSIEPAPVGEASRGGRVVLSYDALEAGELRRERMTVEELEAEARQQQIASLDDVRFAVLETNGQISFATK
jgi:hypothetical protein